MMRVKRSMMIWRARKSLILIRRVKDFDFAEADKRLNEIKEKSKNKERTSGDT